VELRFAAVHNLRPESGQQTVASVIERYLTFAEQRLAGSTLQVRRPYLQSFAEQHGWRLVSACRPDHMEEWVGAHSTWASDWTKNGAIRNVQVAFNWAARGPAGHRLIPENPFKGVTHAPRLPPGAR